MKLKSKFKKIQIIESFCRALSTVFWILILFSFEQPELAITTLICALIHELGHLVCIILLSKEGFKFRGVVNGFRIRPKGMRSYDEQILIYLSGPFANIFALFVCLILSFFTGMNFMMIGIINLVTALSNLLPIKGYDGYGALQAFMKKCELSEVALRGLSYLSSALIFSLCIFSLYLIDRHNGGYWIFAVFFVSMLKEFQEGLK